MKCEFESHRCHSLFTCPCRAARSARHPVTMEIVGSNPIGGAFLRRGARTFGAVAQCRGNRFKPGQVRVRVPLASLRRKDQWLIRLVVRTPGFHPGNGSSILPWVNRDTQHRSPTGRGVWFRSRRLRVRISPVLFELIVDCRELIETAIAIESEEAGFAPHGGL